MRAENARRDQHMSLISEVRAGKMRQLFPDHLTEVLGHDGIAVANFIDTVARDLTEVVAPLPALACAAGAMKTDADKRRAEKKNRIGDFYWRASNLEIQMLKAADRYFSHGFAPFFIEPDMKRKVPVIQADESTGAYYELDRFGDVLIYAKMWYRTIDFLAAQFPELESQIRGEKDGRGKYIAAGSTYLELVRYVDTQSVSLLLPDRHGLILTTYQHGLSGAPAHIVERPGLGETPRGQFDDAVYVQLAKAIMGGLTLEAAENAVQAPIGIPMDVTELPVGPNAVIQTENPQNIRRIGLEVPPAAFQQNQVLDTELHTGTRYPDQRLGQADASVITGKGVQALMGGFDTQIKGAQTMFANGLRRLTSRAFEYDEQLWPKVPRKIQGTLTGSSYEVIYTPAADINGNYSCDVTYGFAAGMAPSQSIITLLQLQGAGLIDDDTVRINLPFDLDPEQTKRNIDIQDIRKAMLQGLFSLVQSAGPMIEQGQDPTKVLIAAAKIAKGRSNGGAIEDLMQQAFTELQQQVQQEQQAAQAAQAGAGAPGAGGDPSSPGGGLMDPTGVTGSAPGQAQQGPGGQPAIQKLIAGMRGNGNTPVLQSTIQRALPASN